MSYTHVNVTNQRNELLDAKLTPVVKFSRNGVPPPLSGVPPPDVSVLPPKVVVPPPKFVAPPPGDAVPSP